MPEPYRWYVGAMNDSLFIIDKPSFPSTDHGPRDVPGVHVVAAVGPSRELQILANVICNEANRHFEKLESQVQLLRAAIEKAPHGTSLVDGRLCAWCYGMDCDCWKLDALRSLDV